jgi:hypothetical protein
MRGVTGDYVLLVVAAIMTIAFIFDRWNTPKF